MREPPTVAVTGAAGFIGSRVVARLRDEHPDWTVTALDNFYLGTVGEVEDVTVEHVDIRYRHALEDALGDADVVMHLAAISGVDDCEANPDLAYEVNVTGTNNVAWWCRKTGAGLVFPFSMAVLGDPDTFPVTIADSREPMNWYGRTKLLGERAIEVYAEDAYPAHLFLKSNLYGEHVVGDQRVSKNTVINFFVDRVLADEPLTVYEPGTQAKNYVHVDDVARAYVRSAERVVEQLDTGQTGVERYEVASEEDYSVTTIAELVQDLARAELGREVEITLVENPRGGETFVDEFAVDISRAREHLGWEPEHTVADSIRRLLRAKDDTSTGTGTDTVADTGTDSSE